MLLCQPCFLCFVEFLLLSTNDVIMAKGNPCTFHFCFSPWQVADEWELRWEDVEIHYNEELGTGTFGRVYRGLLHSRELRDLMNGERTSSRRGSFGRRKSKRKSIHKAVGSCVVAIKRLKG